MKKEIKDLNKKFVSRNIPIPCRASYISFYYKEDEFEEIDSCLVWDFHKHLPKSLEARIKSCRKCEFLLKHVATLKAV
jgi:hypothetical protein